MASSGLGHLLVQEGLLTEADRQLIRRASGAQGASFARGVIAIGLLDEEELAAFLAEKTKWRVADKDLTRESRKDAWGSIDRLLVERLEVMPLRQDGETLVVAMVDPLDKDTIEQLRFFTGCRIHPVIATLTQIRMALGKLLKDFKPARSYLEDFLENHALSASQKLRIQQLGLRGPQPVPNTHHKTPAHDSMKESETTQRITPKSRIDRTDSESKSSEQFKNLDMTPANLGRDKKQGALHKTENSTKASPKNKSQEIETPSHSPTENRDDDLFTDLSSDLDLSSPEEPLKSGAIGKDDSGETTGLEDDLLVFESTDDETAEFTPTETGSSPTRHGSESFLEDEILNDSEPSDPANGKEIENEAIPDFSFIDDLGASDVDTTHSDDLDANAAEEIVALDERNENLGEDPSEDPSEDLGEDLGEDQGESDLVTEDSSKTQSKAPISDEDLFDIGALASDFDTVEASLTDESPIPTPNIESDPIDDIIRAEPLPKSLKEKTGFKSAVPPPSQAPEEDLILDPLDDEELRIPTSSTDISALNHHMLTLSLMSNPTDALEKTVPILIEAGLTRGVTLVVHGPEVMPLLGWGLSERVIDKYETILRRFLSPEVGTWLSSAKPDLNPVPQSALSGSMVLYAPWIAGGQRQIFALACNTKDTAKSLAFVTGWEVVGPVDSNLKNMVSDIFKKIAQQL